MLPKDCDVEYHKTEHSSQGQHNKLNLDGLLSFLQKEVTSREDLSGQSFLYTGASQSQQGTTGIIFHLGKKKRSQQEDLRRLLSVKVMCSSQKSVWVKTFRGFYPVFSPYVASPASFSLTLRKEVF